MTSFSDQVVKDLVGSSVMAALSASSDKPSEFSECKTGKKCNEVMKIMMVIGFMMQRVVT